MYVASQNNNKHLNNFQFKKVTVLITLHLYA